MDRELSAFQQRKRRKKIVRLAVTVLLAITLIIVIAAASWLVLDRLVFKVRHVTVSPSSLYSEEELLSACAIEEGTRLLAVDKKAVERTVTERFPFLTDVEVRLQFPDTVSVTFEEKYGEIALTIGEETFAVDADLMVLARIDGDDVGNRLGVTMDGVSRCVVGETVAFYDEDIPVILSDVVKALEEAELLGIVKSLDISSKFDLHLDYMGRMDVKLGKDKDLDIKLAMVKRVLQELYEEDTGEIDISDPNNAYVRLFDRAA